MVSFPPLLSHSDPRNSLCATFGLGQNGGKLGEKNVLEFLLGGRIRLRSRLEENLKLKP